MSLTKRENNFDLLRIVLALIVVMAHVAILTKNAVFMPLLDFFNSRLAVEGFFVVSGYLISASYENTSSVRSYFEKRLRRIFPAYFTVVLICALFLFFVSGNSFGDYFNTNWIKYLFYNLIFLNFLQSTLPGVFEGQAFSAVNGALWTIKIEVMFYITLPVIIWLMNRVGRLKVMISVYILSVSYALFMNSLASQDGGGIYAILARQLPGQLSFFMSGALLYYYSGHFRRFWVGYLLIGGVCFFLERHLPSIYPLYPFALAVLVICFAIILKHLGNWGRYGDVSYGVYIWHFPLIQLFVALGFFHASPWLAFAMFMVSLFAIALLSWHLIEKPFLRRTSHYRQAESQ